MDGANVEICDSVGNDNIFIFGMATKEVDELWAKGYNSTYYYNNNMDLRKIIDRLKKGFAGKKNPDLWMRFLRVYRRHKVTFIWVKGHASTVENNRCDELAVAAANSGLLSEDTGYQPE